MIAEDLMHVYDIRDDCWYMKLLNIICILNELSLMRVYSAIEDTYVCVVIWDFQTLPIQLINLV